MKATSAAVATAMHALVLILMIAAGPARAATPVGLIAQPCINPATAFIFTNPDSHIAIVPAGACRPTVLTSGADTDQTPNWDGTTIVFQRNGADIGGYSTMTVPAAGGAVTNLGAVACAPSGPVCGSEIQPSFAPNGQILFSTVDGGPTGPYGNFNTSIWVMNADGSSPLRLLQTGVDAISNQAAFVSPDGNTLAFECGPFNSAPFQICKVSLTYTSSKITGISGFTQLTSATGAASADPHWSPDGTKILFNSQQATNVASATVNTGGSGFGASVSGTMTWNGGGCWINPVLNVTTNSSQAIASVTGVQNPGGCNPLPSSASGSWTAGGGLSAGGGASFNLSGQAGVNLFTMTSSGGSVTELTTCVEPTECQDGGWSADGTTIVEEVDWGGNYSQNVNAPAAVWGMTSGGGNPHAVGASCAQSGCAPRFHP